VETCARAKSPRPLSDRKPAHPPHSTATDLLILTASGQDGVDVAWPEVCCSHESFGEEAP
jgi:hypothetical protein